jgi:multiple sugar transport system substrate-binding protein
MSNDHILSYVNADRKMGRRSFLKGVGYSGLALAGSGLLAACGDQSSSASGQIAPKGAKISGKLSIAYLGTADQQKVWNKLFALFQKKYPDVQLTAQGNPSNNWATYFNTISTQIAGGKVPDVVQVATEGQRLFASRGLVVPIDPYLARDKDELAELFADVNPRLQQMASKSSPDNNTYYLPGDFNPMCIWYNAEMFQRAGVAEPSDSWNWDDFLSTAKKLTKSGVYGMATGNGYFTGIMPWLLTNGANVLSSDLKTSTITTPAAIEALTFMRELVSQNVSPAPGGTFDPFQATAQGKLAMFGGGCWPIINMRLLNMVSKMKIARWPQKTQSGSPIGFNAYAIMKDSPNKEAAWAFAKFMTSKDAGEYFVQLGATVVPMRRSIATSDLFLANSPQGMEKLYAALDYGTLLPAPNKENVIELAINNVTSQILTGNVTPQQGASQLDQQITAALA